MDLEDLIPKPPVAEGVWTDFTMVRTGKRLVVHTTEEVENVVYLATIEYGEDGRMESKLLVREDLVRGAK